MSTQRDYEEYANKLTEPHRLTEWQLLRCVIIAVAFIVVMLTMVWQASAQVAGGQDAARVSLQDGTRVDTRASQGVVAGLDSASRGMAESMVPLRPTLPARYGRAFALTTVSYLALSGADFYLSNRCIQAHRCVEIGSYRGVASHPLAFALVKMGASSALAATAWSLRKHHPRAGWAMLAGLTAAQASVVYWNLTQGRVK